jgi:RNA polymerase sigma-70 factor (ECF subfamily)
MTAPDAIRASRETGIDRVDRLLVDRAAVGDREAFDALIQPRLDRLFRMSFAITRSEIDARDATQEACVQAWRELPRLRDRDRFDAWVSQIVVNAARAVVRRTGRRQIREVSVDADSGDRAGGRPVAEPSVPAETEAFAEADAVRRAFARLDGTTRALLVLHYVEGAPLAEIARSTGSPVGTVKWRLSNARRALERALEVERR